MTAGHEHKKSGTLHRAVRRRLLPVLAATSVCLAGMAPAAAANEVRSQQWYLEAMQAEEMWKVSTGEGIKIAVVDTGVNPSTESLRGKILPGKDMTGVPGEATDDYTGHGTTMAEYIVGKGGSGIQGLAPGARVIPIRASLEGLNAGEDRFATSKAVRAAAESDAQIINMSFGLPLPTSDMQEAIDYALSKGKLLFAGVGNNGDDDNLTNYPAAYDGVVGVAATDRYGKVAEFSQYGRSADLAAPGVDVPAWCDEKLQSYCLERNGTSIASAIASASAALIWAKHPDWTANQVLRVLIDTAGRKAKEDVSSKYIGYGAVRPRINLLEGKGDPGAPDQDPIEGTQLSSPSSASPSAAAEKAGNDGKAGDAAKAGGQVDTAASASESDSGPWIYLGAGVAVAVVAVGALALVRRQRRT